MYRNDHDAALARADAAVHEAKILTAENERLATELADAKEWLGGPRKRAMLLVGIVATGVGLAVFGYALGHNRQTVVVEPAPPKVYAEVHGMVFAQGPDVGRWMMKPVRCTPRDIGIELSSLSGDDPSVGIVGNDIEVETPNGTLLLGDKFCFRREVLVRRNVRAPTLLEGFLEVDCQFDSNVVHGYVEFKNCQ